MSKTDDFAHLDMFFLQVLSKMSEFAQQHPPAVAGLQSFGRDRLGRMLSFSA